MSPFPLTKVWSALLLPENGRWQERHAAEKRRLLSMDFTTFQNAMIQIPAQIIRTGRKIVYRKKGDILHFRISRMSPFCPFLPRGVRPLQNANGTARDKASLGQVRQAKGDILQFTKADCSPLTKNRL
jgi:hypothetical protein